jgi:transposase
MNIIGIDLGKVNSQVSVRDESGKEIMNERVATKRAVLEAFFEGAPRGRILLEASTATDWVARCLREQGHEVVVADPNYLPMYVDHKSKRKKTDKKDASLLSLALLNGNWRPAHERSESEQERKTLVDSRARQVRARTLIVNGLRATFTRRGIEVPTCEPERLPTCAKPLLARLSEGLRAIAKLELETLEALNRCIGVLDRQLEEGAKKDDRIRRLTTAPGVGPVVATAFVATIDNPQRFANGHELASFLGLCPSEFSSGEKRVLGHITKAGPKALRFLLVQAAWGIWRSKDPDAAAMKAWARRIYVRRKSKKLAAVALARKLAGVLLAMWKNNKDFDANWSRPQTLPIAA